MYSSSSESPEPGSYCPSLNECILDEYDCPFIFDDAEPFVVCHVDANSYITVPDWMQCPSPCAEGTFFCDLHGYATPSTSICVAGMFFHFLIVLNLD